MKKIINVLVGLILFWSGLIKIIDLEPFQYLIVESKIASWTLSSFIISFIAITEIVVSLFLLFNSFKARALSFILLVLSIFYLLDFFNKDSEMLMKDTFLLHLYNKWITISFTLLIIYQAFYLYLKPNRILFSFSKRWIINGSFILLSSVTLFIINPIFIDDITRSDSTKIFGKPRWEPIFEKCLIEGFDPDLNTFYCFYSTTCYYCNKSGKMFGISDRTWNKKQQIILVFPGEKMDAINFMERNKLDLPFICVTSSEFLAVAGYEFPAFYLVKNNIATNYWTGKTFNYKELDNLFE